MSGWHSLLDAATAPARELAAALADPAACQQRLLQTILAANAQTHFGRRHGFARIRTIEDYRKAVPVRSYADHAAWIDRMAAGESDLLTAADVIAFEETSGSDAQAKLIALTAPGLAAYRAAILPWLHDLATRRPGITGGRSYVAISPATRQMKATTGGLSVGLMSDAAYLGDDLAAAFASLLAVPPEVARMEKFDEWQVRTLAHLVAADDLTFVSVWSPTFFLELIAALPRHADVVASRIEPHARHRLAKALKGSGVDTTWLWPRLDTISCWADGVSAVYARRLAETCPQAVLQAKGLMATEAAMTLPWGETPGCVPALASTVLEFATEDGEVRAAHELEKGACYRLIVTTHGGLYRYDMADVVRCIGFEHAAPRLVFEGRTACISDLVGEKLADVFVARVLSTLPRPAALHPRTGPKPHYELWIDDEKPPTQAIIAHVEEQLCRNPQYAYARRIGQLGPLVARGKPGFQADLNQDASRRGRRLGDLKPLAIIRSIRDERSARNNS